MTIITNSILRTLAYGTVPSDEIQQISTEGLPSTVPFDTYNSKSVGSFVVTETIEGAFRLSVHGFINYDADLQLWFSKKDYGKIDCSCMPGFWCGTGPGYFTFTQDIIENTWCSDGDYSVTTPKINVGDIIELWIYNRYIGSGTVIVDEFDLKFTRIPKLPLYLSAFGCRDKIVSGDTSQITVNIVDDIGTPIEGTTVNLLTTDGTLDQTNGITDINGDFISIYTAPIVTSVQVPIISVTASKPGYEDGSGSTQITVQPIILPQLYATISAIPTTINSEDISQITVHIADEYGTPIEGVTVNLSTTDGTLDQANGTTDTNGDFISIYTAPIVTSIQTPTISVTISKTNYTDGSGSTQITVMPIVQTPLQLYATISALPTTINSEDMSQITVHITDENGIPIEGATVNLSTTGGTLDQTNGTTDTNGDFISIYTAPIVTSVQMPTISVVASKTDYTDGFGSTQITVIPVIQAGFEDIGWMLLEGLFIGTLISKECKYRKTEKECIKAGCEWINGKCIKRRKQTLTSK